MRRKFLWIIGLTDLLWWELEPGVRAGDGCGPRWMGPGGLEWGARVELGLPPPAPVPAAGWDP